METTRISSKTSFDGNGSFRCADFLFFKRDVFKTAIECASILLGDEN